MAAELKHIITKLLPFYKWRGVETIARFML